MNWIKKDLPKGKGGWGRPSDAKLQFALLPSMIGLGSIQALVAASASRNVTWVQWEEEKCLIWRCDKIVL